LARLLLLALCRLGCEGLEDSVVCVDEEEEEDCLELGREPPPLLPPLAAAAADAAAVDAFPAGKNEGPFLFPLGEGEGDGGTLLGGCGTPTMPPTTIPPDRDPVLIMPIDAP
jgi:hypothetical protein